MIDVKAMEERRQKPPKRYDEVRSEYDRDEARLIHSAAFRRLQSKTQVLGLGESDFYRTRLTHSMEVAQIGRGIVQYINESERFSEYKEYLPDMSLITAICLAHDIGHPPFGHGGEVALNYCMRKYGGFEGNGQTLRILGKIEKYTDEYGLNPTRRMLLGVLKYPVSYNELVDESFYKVKENAELPYWLFKADTQKPPKCYYDVDKDIVSFIFKAFSKEDKKNFFKLKEKKVGEHKKTKFKSLDCTIMNLADNISYSLHDLEDALSLGMINEKQWQSRFEDKHYLLDNKANKIERNELEFASITKQLFSSKSHERKNAIGSLINLMITSIVIVNNGSDCTDPLLYLEVKLEEEIEELRELICNLVYDIVIKDENVQQLEFKGQKLIIELFQVLSEDPERFLPKSTKERWAQASQDAEKNPKNYLLQSVIEKLEQEEKSVVDQAREHAQMRVICDFIAGMTDDYATKFYEKFFTPNKGSIFDRL